MDPWVFGTPNQHVWRDNSQIEGEMTVTQLGLRPDYSCKLPSRGGEGPHPEDSQAAGTHHEEQISSKPREPLHKGR